MRTPVEGAAGLGYILGQSYDLPPLNFDSEEIEALQVGLLMLARTGDRSLRRAAQRIGQKIADLNDPADWLLVAPWAASADDPSCGCVSKAELRMAIRRGRELRLIYRNGEDSETTRVIRPIALFYHIRAVILVGWCELRGSFRHFCTDWIYGCEVLQSGFYGQGRALRGLWSEHNSFENMIYSSCHPADLAASLGC